MTPDFEIVGGAGPYETAAVAAALHAILSESEARSRQMTTVSRWRVELPQYEPSGWGVGQPAGAPGPAPPIRPTAGSSRPRPAGRQEEG